MARTLRVPEELARRRAALEILRVFLDDGRPVATFRGVVWDDPGAWGLLMADLAGQLAEAYEAEHSLEPSEVIERIRQGFVAGNESWLNRD